MNFFISDFRGFITIFLLPPCCSLTFKDYYKGMIIFEETQKDDLIYAVSAHRKGGE